MALATVVPVGGSETGASWRLDGVGGGIAVLGGGAGQWPLPPESIERASVQQGQQFVLELGKLEAVVQGLESQAPPGPLPLAAQPSCSESLR